MFDVKKIRGFIFDYGGTIDTGGIHWGVVLWEAYRKFGIPVERKEFERAYVYAERYVALHKVIKAAFNYYNLLFEKICLQLSFLRENGVLERTFGVEENSERIASECYGFAKDTVSHVKPVLTRLKKNYPLVLVSNFYGNLSSVLKDFCLDGLFDSVIESSVVGFRKPDLQIFRMGVASLGLAPGEITVVGDSLEKDIVPASLIGCHTVWMKGRAWYGSTSEGAREKAEIVITCLKDLENYF